MQTNAPKDSQDEVRVRRGRVESVDLYEIKDSELDELERGSPANLQFNIAVALLSIAFSFLACIATSTFDKPIYQTLYVVVMVVGFIVGGVLLLFWLRNRRSVSDLCRKIRGRIPVEPERVPSTASSVSSGQDEDLPKG
jgi:uncharacterized membrane protein YciS (DUF1049 family)